MTREPVFPDTRVEDIMHRGVITCSTNTLLKEVVRILADTDITALAVVDDSGSIAGILSRMDLLRLYGQNLLKYKASDLMTSKVIDTDRVAPIKEAVATMPEYDVHRLFVTDETAEGKRLVGVLSATDVVKNMRQQPWFW